MMKILEQNDDEMDGVHMRNQISHYRTLTDTYFPLYFTTILFYVMVNNTTLYYDPA